jgi:Peptidase family M48.
MVLRKLLVHQATKHMVPIIKNLYSKIFPEINFELGQKYSDKYKSLIGKDISVYTFKHTDDMPFAFLIENNDKPDIYIEEDLIDELSSNEMDMLLLHELGHYKAHHERKKNISVKIFIFSFCYSYFHIHFILTQTQLFSSMLLHYSSLV